MAVKRMTLQDLDLPAGKQARLYRMLYQYGPGHGHMMVLPIDQGLEHGPRDFFINPESIDPDFQLRLAHEGGFSAIAFQIGLAEKHFRAFAGKVPLILKINGRTEIPPSDEAFSSLTASVRDAVRLGADAVGYTCYIGSPAQDRDFLQFDQVRREAERFGMPVVMWAYPRGRDIEKKGGRESLYAVDYAARVAQELGADVVKINFPHVDEAKRSQYPKPYDQLTLSPEEMVRKVVTSAGRTLVLISGGPKVDDAALLEEVGICLRGGVTGFIFGRNMWQRRFGEAIKMATTMTNLMQANGRTAEQGEHPPAASRAKARA